MEYKLGKIDNRTGMLDTDQRNLASKVYDAVTSDYARKLAIVAIPVGLAALASGCAAIEGREIDWPRTIINIIDGG